MDRSRPTLNWARRKWRAFCTARRQAAEVNPSGLKRLAEEVRTLAETARRVCPPEHRLQSRIRGIHEEMHRLAELAAEPDFRRLGPDQRHMLRRGLVSSREQLLRAMGQAKPPTRFLQ